MDDNSKNLLGDQVKKLNVALFYSNNDMVKAKQMVAGSYKDLLVIKGRFSSSSLYGIFQIFFNKIYSKAADITFVISPDYELASINTNQDWRTFEKDLIEFSKKNENVRAGVDIRDKIERGFSMQVSSELSKLYERGDQVQMQHLIQKLLQESTGFKRVDLNVEFQEISSLDMEFDSQLSRKLDSKSIAPPKEGEQPPAAASAAVEENEPTVGKDGIKLIVKGALNLSPVKGKHISQIVPGDRVMVTMIEQNPQTIQIATAFKAFDAEHKRIMPISARITSVKFFDGVGYKLYALIAKGVLSQIVEEETNIKVALDPVYAKAVAQTPVEDDSKAGISVPAIIGLVAVILVLLGVAIFIVFG